MQSPVLGCYVVLGGWINPWVIVNIYFDLPSREGV
jgi:hypothetical protein